jgi:phosphoglycolate phosphatase-like HAD superfamily hydrolase
MKPVALLDFDQTLFQTDKFLADLFALLLPPTGDDLFSSYRLYQQTNSFRPEGFANFLEETRSIPATRVLSSMTQLFTGLAAYRMPGAADFFHQLHRLGWEAWILTQGDRAWQERKIRSSGFDQLADRILIAPPGKDKAQTLRTATGPRLRGVCLDDRLDELQKIGRRFPRLALIQKLEGGSKKTGGPFPAFERLEEVMGWMKMWYDEGKI